MRARRSARPRRIALVGIGGPAGAGKTALIEQLILRLMARGTEVAVITCGRSRTPGAVSLRRSGWIAPERVANLRPGAGVEKEATSVARAVGDMAARIPGLELILIEQHGRASPMVALDYRLRVIDADARAEENAERGAREACDLLVVNKTDLTPAVGRTLESSPSDNDDGKPRGGARQVVAASCATGVGVDRVVSLIVQDVLGSRRVVAAAGAAR